MAVSRQHAGNDVENVLPADSSRAVVRISHRVDIRSASVHAASMQPSGCSLEGTVLIKQLLHKTSLAV